jgi:hypothetical protein
LLVTKLVPGGKDLINKIAGFIGLFAQVGNAITGLSFAGAVMYVAWTLTAVVVRYWNRRMTDAEYNAAQEEEEVKVD